MVQGSFKSKSKTSQVSLKRKPAVKHMSRENKKGEVLRNTKGGKVFSQHVAERKHVTAVINAKNEVDVTARAMKAGKKFWLKDVKEAGAAEVKKMNTTKVKKESHGDKLNNRLKEKLKALGKEL